jgi:Uma2 family endonuclease
MALQRPREFTIEEFEAFIALSENADRRFELIDGEVVEKVPTEEHGVIVSIINGEIYVYLKRNPIGRVAVEARHKMPDDRRNSRIPDLAFTSAERALPITRQGAVPQMPDLAVEVKSPDDSINLLRAKAAYYLANGSRMVWLVYPEQRLVEVYRLDVDVLLLVDNEERHDVLDGGDVLPGFELPLRDIFSA